MPTPVDTCTTDVTGNVTCINCTGQPYVPTIPPHVVSVPILDWNAGANLADDTGLSQKVLDGNFELSDFTVGPCGGVVVGIAPPPRERVQDPATFTHAWYLTTVNTALVAQALEHGVPVGDPVIGDVDVSLFSIQRIDGQIFFRADLDGDTTYEIVFVSANLSYGYMLAGTAMFLTGDTIR